VQPAVNGAFSRPPRHVSRFWQLANQFGTIKVRSKKVTALLVPASKSLSAPPAAPPDATHYVCYDVSAVQDEYTDQTPGTCSSSAPTNARGPCPDDAACGGGSGQFVLCSEPRFRRDLQSFFLDQFGDCALNEDGGVSFSGAVAQGMCLFDLRNVKELCNPIDKTAVEAPRETAAVIAPSTAMSTPSVLCYKPRLALRIGNATTAALASVPMQAPVEVGDRIDPGQSKHVKHRTQDGNAVYTTPGNLFPAPHVVNTNKQELVCIPTSVLGVSNAAP
jgi:hypothetical protein